MATVQVSAALKDLIGDARVIDADAHFTEPPDLWTSRAPAAYKDRVPRMKTVEGRDRWFLEDDTPWAILGPGVYDREGRKRGDTVDVPTLEEMDEAIYRVKPRLQLMDRLGIHAQVTYPNTFGFAGRRFVDIKDVELRNQCLSIYNDACAEWQQESNGRLFPQALLPLWDVDATLKELRRVKEELHLTGVTITDRIWALDLPDFSQPYWEPFWELINDLELPVNIHIGASLGTLDPVGAWPSLSIGRKIVVFFAVAYTDTFATILNFIFSGLLDRYPKLKIVSVESGCGWIPFAIEAAEHNVNDMVPNAAKITKRRPREYFQDRIYATFWFEEEGVERFVDIVGANTLLYMTDYPHPTSISSVHQEYLARVLARLEPAARRRVVQDNAVELYKLPVPV